MTNSTMILAPSLLSSDFGNLENELHSLEKAGLSWIHWDVMDGMFVPNITFGPPVIQKLRSTSSLFFDVHLMIETPERYLKHFANAGADLLVIHAEATRHLDRTLQGIRDLGMKAGVALNPATPITTIQHVIHLVDVVLIMSVNPGFGGQRFISESIPKISQLAQLLEAKNSQAIIEVDGGVDPANIAALYTAGADAFVSGSAFFAYPPYAERLETFCTALANAERSSFRRQVEKNARSWKNLPA